MTGSLRIKGNKYYVVARMPDENGRSRPKWISMGLEVTGNNKREAKRIMQRILVDLGGAERRLFHRNILPNLDRQMDGAEKAGSAA